MYPYRQYQLRKAARILNLLEKKRSGEITQEQYERERSLAGANMSSTFTSKGHL